MLDADDGHRSACFVKQHGLLWSCVEEDRHVLRKALELEVKCQRKKKRPKKEKEAKERKRGQRKKKRPKKEKEAKERKRGQKGMEETGFVRKQVDYWS